MLEFGVVYLNVSMWRPKFLIICSFLFQPTLFSMQHFLLNLTLFADLANQVIHTTLRTPFSNSWMLGLQDGRHIHQELTWVLKTQVYGLTQVWEVLYQHISNHKYCWFYLKIISGFQIWRKCTNCKQHIYSLGTYGSKQQDWQLWIVRIFAIYL